MRTPALALSVVLLVAATVVAGGGPPGRQAGGGGGIRGGVWHWTGSRHDETRIEVPDPDHYTLALTEDGTARIRADCNRVRGGYRLAGDRLTVQLGPATLAMCPPKSLDGAYLEGLAAVESWKLRGGERVLILGSGGGTMEFERGDD